MIKQGEFVRGTLVDRFRRCGRANCHCASGEGHHGLYLYWSEGGRQRGMYVPKRWEKRVREWVSNYHKIKGLLEEGSQRSLARLRDREG